MAGERPAFTLEAAKKGSAGLPVEAWASALAGVALVAGAAIARLPAPCPMGTACESALGFPLVATLVTAALVVGAVTWFGLPVRENREALVRAAALSAVSAGVAVVGAGLVAGFLPEAALLAVAVGFGVPIATLPALRPEAALEAWGRRKRRSLLWLRAGGPPVLGAALGLYGGFLLETSLSPAQPVAPTLSWDLFFGRSGGWSPALVAGGCLLVLAGVLTLVLGAIPPAGDAAEAHSAGSRVRSLVRLTPMLRFDFLAEATFAFAAAATLTAVLLSPFVTAQRLSAVAALALGAGVGVVFHALLAPTLDYALGRGRLLACTPLAGALFPLATGAGLATSDPFPLLAAGALWAFGASLAPQRFALLFDLAPSRGRLRAAADLHGAKLGAASIAPAAYWSLENLSAGSGLLIASVACLAALAFFAPTLGGLGRRQK